MMLIPKWLGSATKKENRFMGKFFVVLLALTSAISAAPITVFSNFGPRNTYNTSNSWSIGNSPVPSTPNIYGAAFTPSQNVTFSSLSLALNYQVGANQFIVSLDRKS